RRAERLVVDVDAFERSGCLSSQQDTKPLLVESTFSLEEKPIRSDGKILLSDQIGVIGNEAVGLLTPPLAQALITVRLNEGLKERTSQPPPANTVLLAVRRKRSALLGRRVGYRVHDLFDERVAAFSRWGGWVVLPAVS